MFLPTSVFTLAASSAVSMKHQSGACLYVCLVYATQQLKYSK